MEDKEITYIDRRNGRRHSMNAKAAAIFEDSPSRKHMEDKEITYIDRRNGRRHSMNAKAAAIFEDSPSRKHYELAIDSPPAAKPAPREQVSKPDEDSSRSRGTKSETKAEAKSDPKPEAKAESKPADEPKPAEIKTPITKTNDDRKS